MRYLPLLLIFSVLICSFGRDPIDVVVKDEIVNGMPMKVLTIVSNGKSYPVVRETWWKLKRREKRKLVEFIDSQSDLYNDKKDVNDLFEKMELSEYLTIDQLKSTSAFKSSLIKIENINADQLCPQCSVNMFQINTITKESVVGQMVGLETCSPEHQVTVGKNIIRIEYFTFSKILNLFEVNLVRSAIASDDFNDFSDGFKKDDKLEEGSDDLAGNTYYNKQQHTTQDYNIVNAIHCIDSFDGSVSKEVDYLLNDNKEAAVKSHEISKKNLAVAKDLVEKVDDGEVKQKLLVQIERKENEFNELDRAIKDGDLPDADIVTTKTNDEWKFYDIKMKAGRMRLSEYDPDRTFELVSVANDGTVKTEEVKVEAGSGLGINYSKMKITDIQDDLIVGAKARGVDLKKRQARKLARVIKDLDRNVDLDELFDATVEGDGRDKRTQNITLADKYKNDHVKYDAEISRLERMNQLDLDQRTKSEIENRLGELRDKHQRTWNPDEGSITVEGDIANYGNSSKPSSHIIKLATNIQEDSDTSVKRNTAEKDNQSRNMETKQNEKVANMAQRDQDELDSVFTISKGVGPKSSDEGFYENDYPMEIPREQNDEIVNSPNNHFNNSPTSVGVKRSSGRKSGGSSIGRGVVGGGTLSVRKEGRGSHSQSSRYKDLPANIDSQVQDRGDYVCVADDLFQNSNSRNEEIAEYIFLKSSEKDIVIGCGSVNARMSFTCSEDKKSSAYIPTDQQRVPASVRDSDLFKKLIGGEDDE